MDHRQEHIEQSIRKLNRKIRVYSALLGTLIIGSFFLPNQPAVGLTATQVQVQSGQQQSLMEMMSNAMQSVHDVAVGIAGGLR